MTNQSLSAAQYLEQSSKGKKFIYEEIPIGMGPFGDELYSDVEHLGFAFDERDGASENLLDLEFIDNESDERSILDKWLSGEMVYHGQQPLLLIATPRDPKGPFTISVYEAERHIGWIVGNDAQGLAEHLVENFDFGAAVFEVFSFLPKNERIDPQIRKAILDKNEVSISLCRITSKSFTRPKELEWDSEPSFIQIPTGATWDGDVQLTTVCVEDPESLEASGLPDLEGIMDAAYSSFVPNIWDEQSREVFVFVDEIYVGKICDSELSEEYFDKLTKPGHSIGLGKQIWVNRDDNGVIETLDIPVIVRDIHRIDWDLFDQELGM
jgi:hypothetical protein